MLSVSNLLSKREKIQREILSVERKSDIHMDLQQGLNTIALNACNTQITNTCIRYMDETISPKKRLSLRYKIEKLRVMSEHLNHFTRPQYCLNCDLKVEALKEQLGMIEAILKQRNVTNP